MVAFLGMLIPVSLIFAYFSFTFTNHATLDTSIKYMEQLTGQINYGIDAYISYMENIANMLNQNSAIRNYLNLEAESSAQVLAERRLAEQITTTLKVRKDRTEERRVGRE